MRPFLLGAGLVAFLAACASMPEAAAPGQGPVVQAAAGPVEGVREGDVSVFRGIPYAQPPVGLNRWRPPLPMEPWTRVRRAVDFGPACIQPTPRVSTIYSQDLGSTSENCLSLNVWSPNTAGKAPVIVWIHGGSLVAGSSKEPMYDGATLAEEGVVVVSINYRLGVLGYLAHPGLSRESPTRTSGNYGVMDQIAALEWVQRNIAAFGGDPDNVTVAGESAGGLSILYLLTAPGARGLFDKAIAQSSYFMSMSALRDSVHGAPSAEQRGAAIASALQAADVAALRNMDPQTLTDGAALAGFFPAGIIDGVVLREEMLDVFNRGEQAPVPILAGFNSGEIRSLRVLAPAAPASAGAYDQAIRERYGDLADEYLRLYPAATMDESILASTRDAFYGWTAERLTRSQAAIGQPSYLYMFDHGYPAMDEAGLHAFHASELPYLFGTLRTTPPNWPVIPDTAVETRISDAMIDYWTSFARSGRPQSDHGPAWSAFGAAGGPFMAFRDVPVLERDLHPGAFAVHESAVCRKRVAGNLGWYWNVGLNSPVLPPSAACP
ncbi:carboxylesterase family protein [Brevundimonas sp. NIBR11]|uniref:carboxylesterase/lipase family protein n=1 Tax=Brevundimonas sp. NIBR11 TaxID=3015999 RepID=UPI0022F0152D|nr:carboxylesterase family protein [Brevundimonas sp. NIBR11]WGM30557.1 Fumonisin B1 esterase [Brevundimonas sp. NIBR11]